jgi:hypothetical protein
MPSKSAGVFKLAMTDGCVAGNCMRDLIVPKIYVLSIVHSFAHEFRIASLYLEVSIGI